MVSVFSFKSRTLLRSLFLPVYSDSDANVDHVAHNDGSFRCPHRPPMDHRLATLQAGKRIDRQCQWVNIVHSIGVNLCVYVCVTGSFWRWKRCVGEVVLYNSCLRRWIEVDINEVNMDAFRRICTISKISFFKKDSHIVLHRWDRGHTYCISVLSFAFCSAPYHNVVDMTISKVSLLFWIPSSSRLRVDMASFPFS